MKASPGDVIERVRFAARRAALLGDDFKDATALALLTQSSERPDRELAARLAFQDAIRRAADRLHDVVALDGYLNNEQTTELVRLSRLGEYRLPILEMLKRRGLTLADAGHFEGGLDYLEHAQLEAAVCSTATRMGRLAWNYLCDAEIDAAYEKLASLKPFECTHPSSGMQLRCAIVASGIVDENSGTAYIRNMASTLRACGLDAYVISTGHARAPGERARADFERIGVEVFDAGAGTYEERLSKILDHVTAAPLHAAVFVPFIMDGIAKIMSCIGVAPVQTYIMSSFEPYCGRFDRMLFINENQLAVAHGPSPAEYLGNGAGIGELVDAAYPIGRAALGIPEGGTLFGTVGRVLKLFDGYVPATVEILRGDGEAMLAIAGPASDAEQRLIDDMYRAAGVRDRVFLLGRRQHDVGGILKTLDVYLDPFPESGGQALFEAMRSGKPVVGMEDAPMPTEFRVPMCLSAASERLGGVVEIARGGSGADYARIALAYARDPERRARDGAALVAHSRERYDPRAAMVRLARLLNDLVVEKGGARS